MKCWTAARSLATLPMSSLCLSSSAPCSNGEPALCRSVLSLCRPKEESLSPPLSSCSSRRSCLTFSL
eukprot:CAMPEP_0169455692 /NCGR_PEP_ID=MMETSP1042-20121227/15950_1 /TAXON_ID=464988 /ORGANISM="Hemiselmis andersenii, Strain CCMP1180" /LENGTH=66 /DNA_ID=CAMNT_0009567855 /DNA_START=44 /DNA_END=241 /DNA_ORIENTATION=+